MGIKTTILSEIRQNTRQASLAQLKLTSFPVDRISNEI